MVDKNKAGHERKIVTIDLSESAPARKRIGSGQIVAMVFAIILFAWGIKVILLGYLE